MILKEAIVRNYKSHQETRVPFNKELTVLMGENGTGKTAFLEALDLFFDFNEINPKKPFPQNLFVDKDGKVANFMEVECAFDNHGREIRIKKRWELEDVVVKDPKIYIFEDGSWREISFDNEWIKRLPRFVLFTFEDYKNPDLYLRKLLSVRLYDLLRENHMDRDLRRIEKEIQELLTLDLKNILKYLEKKSPENIRAYRIYPVFSLESALENTVIEVDDGRGFHKLSEKWSGLRRTLFLSLTEWDSKNKKYGNIIYAYDHPDRNLHIEGQRRFYNYINSLSNVQVILATHSIVFAERTPFNKIVVFSLSSDGITYVDYLSSEKDVEEFAEEVSRSTGLSARDLFFERAILIVEGYTEEEYLPIVYRKLYERSMEEDGIRLVNLEGNGAAKPFLKLVRYKMEKLFFLLDRDTQHSTARISPHILRELGYPESFLRERITFIGKKEFEDAFPTMFLVNVLNKRFPRRDGKKWTFKEIEYLKEHSRKFSARLMYEILSKTGIDVSKPEFGRILAEETNSEDDIPIEIRELFEKIREYLRLG